MKKLAIFNGAVERFMSCPALSHLFNSCPSRRCITLDECYILLTAYDPTWKATSSVSIIITGAAWYLGTEAQSQLWSTQNLTSFLAMVS